MILRNKRSPATPCVEREQCLRRGIRCRSHLLKLLKSKASLSTASAAQYPGYRLPTCETCENIGAEESQTTPSDKFDLIVSSQEIERLYDSTVCRLAIVFDCHKRRRSSCLSSSEVRGRVLRTELRRSSEWEVNKGQHETPVAGEWIETT